MRKNLGKRCIAASGILQWKCDSELSFEDRSNMNSYFAF